MPYWDVTWRSWRCSLGLGPKYIFWMRAKIHRFTPQFELETRTLSEYVLSLYKSISQTKHNQMKSNQLIKHKADGLILNCLISKAYLDLWLKFQTLLRVGRCDANIRGHSSGTALHITADMDKVAICRILVSIINYLTHIERTTVKIHRLSNQKHEP